MTTDSTGLCCVINPFSFFGADFGTSDLTDDEGRDGDSGDGVRSCEGDVLRANVPFVSESESESGVFSSDGITGGLARLLV